MGNNKMFFGGVPTEIELNKLKEKWPESKMTAGDFFPYAEVGEVIGAEYGSNRFRTVTDRWRKNVENSTGTIIGPVDGEGFKVLSTPEKFSLGLGKLRASAKSARRALVIFARTNRKELPENERALYDHAQNTGAKVIAAAQIRRKIEQPTM